MSMNITNSTIYKRPPEGAVAPQRRGILIGQNPRQSDHLLGLYLLLSTCSINTLSVIQTALNGSDCCLIASAKLERYCPNFDAHVMLHENSSSPSIVTRIVSDIYVCMCVYMCFVFLSVLPLVIVRDYKKLSQSSLKFCLVEGKKVIQTIHLFYSATVSSQV